MRNLQPIASGVLCAALVLGLWGAANQGTGTRAAASEAGASPAGGPAPSQAAPQRMATCDVYKVMRRLFESDRYSPQRKVEHDKAESELRPKAEELNAIRQQLATADPNDAKAQEQARDYQARGQAFRKREAELEKSYQVFMAGQFVECYDLARQAAAKIALKEGFTHVVATRGHDEKIAAENPDSLMEQFLGRPMLVHPEEEDLTEKVLVDLQLPLKDEAKPAQPDPAPKP